MVPSSSPPPPPPLFQLPGQTICLAFNKGKIECSKSVCFLENTAALLERLCALFIVTVGEKGDRNVYVHSVLMALPAGMGQKGRALEQKLLENKGWIRSVTCRFYVTPRRRPLSDTQCPSCRKGAHHKTESLARVSEHFSGKCRVVHVLDLVGAAVSLGISLLCPGSRKAA